MINWIPFIKNGNIYEKTKDYDLPIQIDDMAEYLIKDNENIIIDSLFNELTQEQKQIILDIIKERTEILFTIKINSLDNIYNFSIFDNIILCFECSNLDDINKFADVLAINKTLVLNNIEKIDNLNIYNLKDIQEIDYSGENIQCDFNEVKKISDFCQKEDITFKFLSTGNLFLYNGKTYKIPDNSKIAQAKLAKIDYISKKRLQKIHKHIVCNGCRNLFICKPGINKCKKY